VTCSICLAFCSLNPFHLFDQNSTAARSPYQQALLSGLDERCNCTRSNARNGHRIDNAYIAFSSFRTKNPEFNQLHPIK
jgi:hypothetical protein